MTSARDDFTTKTKDRLAHRAGHRCSDPACRVLTSGSTKGSADGVINVGVAAHITAASPGGPRYDATLSPDQRRSADNGIWLCATHGKMVDDDEGHFTVEQLRRWKRTAEERAHEEVGRAPEASSPAPSARAKTAFPILPHFTALVHGGRPIAPRDFALWVAPSASVELSAGEARAAVASGAGAHGWAALPFSQGRDVSDMDQSHPQLGRWVGLWTIDMGDHAINHRRSATLGMSDHGVLAWQFEEAFDNPHDVVRLADTITEIGSFVGMAHRVYVGLDELEDARLRMHAAIDTPRPDRTILEVLGLFELGRIEFRLKANSPRMRARATLDPNVPEAETVGRLTHKLANQLLASCRSSPGSFGAKVPPIASLERETIDRLLPR